MRQSSLPLHHLAELISCPLKTNNLTSLVAVVFLEVGTILLVTYISIIVYV